VNILNGWVFWVYWDFILLSAIFPLIIIASNDERKEKEKNGGSRALETLFP